MSVSKYAYVSVSNGPVSVSKDAVLKKNNNNNNVSIPNRPVSVSKVAVSNSKAAAVSNLL